MTARILFDLDGTLVESLPGMAAAGNRLISELGRDPVDLATYGGFVGRGIRVQLQELLRHTGGIPDGAEDRLLVRLSEIYDEDPVSGTASFDGAADALAQLASRGHRLGVVTQKETAPTRRILSHLGLDQFITVLTCGDTYPFLKPDPRMITCTAEQLGDGPVVLVGDSLTDAETARAAEIPFILKHGGYGDQTVPIAADAVFGDFNELPDLIDRVLG